MADQSAPVQVGSPFATLRAVRRRATEAVLGQSGLAHPSLASAVRRSFSSADVDMGALVGEPVLEAAFPHLAGEETLESLSPDLIHRDVLRALTCDGAGRVYQFPRDLKPYRHQLEAWRLLRDPTPRSVLVTSGTGSGKTECFLVPLLDDLAREAAEAGRLSGVRAIALYPLNALIASQEERLREWTAPFGGRVRFGLYNGEMQEDAKGRASPPEQVIDRRTLRKDPPPILVTNATMLEYMTVRRQDQSLLDRSQGRLRWIILDEAHSYVGSSAAEIALLIRRVLLAFGVTPDQVRFVATSATIGEGEDLVDKLRSFLTDVSGAASERVHVVTGVRRFPTLAAPVADPRLAEADPLDRGALLGSPVVRNLVEAFRAGPMAWSAFRKAVQPSGRDPEDLARALARPNGSEPVLPLRVHGFIRAVPGLWACLDPICPAKPEGDWPFGGVMAERTETCPHCAAAVLEIVVCADCGEPFLTAVERDGRLHQRSTKIETDEFAAGAEADDVDDRADDVDTEGNGAGAVAEYERLLAARDYTGGRPLNLEWATGAVRDSVSRSTFVVRSHDREAPDCCPACGATARQGSDPGTLLRSFRYGAPFLIGNAAPVLLDDVEPPPLKPDPNTFAPPPYGGRQLLSFTDSRQSTARFAASLQGASERGALRAIVYHAVQDSMRPPPDAAAEKSKLDAEIAGLRAANLSALAELLASKIADRSALDQGSTDGVSWRTLRTQIAARPEVEWIRKVWSPRDRRFDTGPGSDEFAEFLMLRELARRPRRANSLETLGLARLRFDHIDKLAASLSPRAFRERGRTLSEWRHFLYLLIGVHVRARFALRIARDDVRWLIRHGFRRNLLRPGAEKTGSVDLTWPRARAVGKPAIVVRLLERVLGLDAGVAGERAELNEILSGAWDCLLPLFSQPGAGDQYALDFDKAHVAPVVEAYLCPVSRRLLDVTFDCLSPYGFDGTSRRAGEACERVAMPAHPNPHLVPENGGVAAVEDWLAADPTVAALRERGLWTDLHDRIASGSPYSRAAEHSAQQPPKRLRRYESEFKAGRINILNCSTTMEMGVDIGSVQSVMMTNVPPSIANYRQRVGRAGRRGQGFSTALTYTRDTPLDREAFRDPGGYLGRTLEAPRVSLDSRRIVQRHVNALLLAAWFREAGGEALKAKAGEFFGCPVALGAARSENPPSARFRAWLALPSSAEHMAGALATLVRGSALADDPRLLAQTEEGVERAEKRFADEWAAIQAQAAGMDREAARKSLGFQLKRMCEEYLLGELADRGVLPGHGFPTAVVPFINSFEPDAEEPTPDGEGGRFRRRSFPSRNLDVAIRDYAPGAEVVIDGLVYRSAGVTLNWKRPAAAEATREIQSLKWFWECGACGAADTGRIRPESCDACGAALEDRGARRFLEPAGFTVDDRDEPHAEIERVAYVEPEPERVSARDAAWLPFLEPTRGRLRGTHDGLVFYSSRGAARLGYAICLECGRAEAEGTSANGQPPFDQHRPLRFTKRGDDGRCPGTERSFALQFGLALGHDISTDVAEIQPHALADRNGAVALASALRSALARRLGIEPSEMGLSVTARTNAVGGPTHSVFLFDRSPGGAGYAPRLVGLFEDLLRDARGILDCGRRGCVRGCSACVLSSDLYGQAETIDRRAALAFVCEEIRSSATPEGPDALGPGARFARDAADELAKAADAGPVTLWPSAPPDASALTRGRLGALIAKLRDRGQSVAVCLDPDHLDALDEAGRLALRDAAIGSGFVLAIGRAPTLASGARTIATACSGLTLASRDVTASEFGDAWGLGSEAPVVRFEAQAPDRAPIALDALLPKPGTVFVATERELDGPSRSFGRRLANLLRPKLGAIGRWRPGRLKEMRYSDRYVASPLVAQLLIGALSALNTELGSPSCKTPVVLTTRPLKKGGDGLPFRFEHDWRTEADRAGVLAGFGASLDLAVTLAVGDCRHSRRLELIYETEAAVVILDQGVGFLRPRSPQRFDFRASTAEQAEALSVIDADCAAVGPSYAVLLQRPSSPITARDRAT